ncbi:MAG: replicative DNA helicase [Phycisphaerae bacterium]|nr:replicative DNA helicase [Phycisphaerae bacterium]
MAGKGPARPGQLSSYLEALPPHAIEAEMSLLGAMLWDHKVIGDVVGIIRTGNEFYKPAHAAIFDAMIALYDRHASMDTVQLHQHLVDSDSIDAVGGLDYIVKLAESVPSAANAMEYARLVREKATIRQLIEAAGEILVEAHDASDDSQSLLERAEQRIFTIAQRREQASISELKDLLDETMRILESNEGSAITGVESGFPDLDELMCGLQSGEMIIVAGRPSMGKTAFALNVLEHVAVSGTAVAMFSLEMGKQQLVQRLLCARGGIDSQRLRRNMLRAEDYRRLMAACGELSDAPIYIDDTPGLTLLGMRSKARRLKDKYDIGAVVIDYLQLMNSGQRVESRQLEVSEISRGVKAMARELNVPVICLSQLNRASEQREGHRPRMSDLRESGSLEQDADVVMMLHREEYYHQSDPSWAEENSDKMGTAELIVAKQRNGPTGVVRLGWDPDATRFRPLTFASPPADMDNSYYEAGGSSGMVGSNPIQADDAIGDLPI